MKSITLLAGNFGIGKTTISDYYPHNPSGITGLRLYDQFDLYGLGGQRGTDDLSGMGFKKERVFDEIIRPNDDKHIIIHGVYYQQTVDIARYRASHDLQVIFLETTYENNHSRWTSRGRAFNDETYRKKVIEMNGFKKSCERFNVPHFLIDNNRPIEEVAAEVWKIIYRRIRRK